MLFFEYNTVFLTINFGDFGGFSLEKLLLN